MSLQNTTIRRAIALTIVAASMSPVAAFAKPSGHSASHASVPHSAPKVAHSAPHVNQSAPKLNKTLAPQMPSALNSRIAHSATLAQSNTGISSAGKPLNTSILNPQTASGNTGISSAGKPSLNTAYAPIFNPNIVNPTPFANGNTGIAGTGMPKIPSPTPPSHTPPVQPHNPTPSGLGSTSHLHSLTNSNALNQGVTFPGLGNGTSAQAIPLQTGSGSTASNPNIKVLNTGTPFTPSNPFGSKKNLPGTVQGTNIKLGTTFQTIPAATANGAAQANTGTTTIKLPGIGNIFPGKVITIPNTTTTPKTTGNTGATGTTTPKTTGNTGATGTTTPATTGNTTPKTTGTTTPATTGTATPATTGGAAQTTPATTGGAATPAATGAATTAGGGTGGGFAGNGSGFLGGGGLASVLSSVMSNLPMGGGAGGGGDAGGGGYAAPAADYAPAPAPMDYSQQASFQQPAFQPAPADQVSSVDLVLEDAKVVNPATRFAGPAIAVTYHNSGSIASPRFMVSVVASDDGQYRADAPRTAVEVPGLAAGQSNSVVVRMPRGDSKYVILAIDANGSVNELDKDNNSAVVELSSL